MLAQNMTNHTLMRIVQCFEFWHVATCRKPGESVRAANVGYVGGLCWFDHADTLNTDPKLTGYHKGMANPLTALTCISQ